MKDLEEALASKKQQTLNHTPQVKYASARVKLLRTESNQLSSENVSKD